MDVIHKKLQEVAERRYRMHESLYARIPSLDKARTTTSEGDEDEVCIRAHVIPSDGGWNGQNELVI